MACGRGKEREEGETAEIKCGEHDGRWSGAEERDRAIGPSFSNKLFYALMEGSARGGFAVHFASPFRVSIRRGTGLERRMIRTDVPVPSVPVRLFVNLVDIEPLGR